MADLVNERIEKDRLKGGKKRRKEIDERKKRAEEVTTTLALLAMSNKISHDDIPDVDELTVGITLSLTQMTALAEFVNNHLAGHLDEVMKTVDKGKDQREKIEVVFGSLALADAVDKLMDAADDVSDRALTVLQKFLDGVIKNGK